MEPFEVDIDTAVPIGMIVNELLTNSLKYAFPAGRIGEVQIRWAKNQNNLLQLDYSDDGIGKTGATSGTGFGTQLIGLPTKHLNGTLQEKAAPGFVISFVFKKVRVK